MYKSLYSLAAEGIFTLSLWATLTGKFYPIASLFYSKCGQVLIFSYNSDFAALLKALLAANETKHFKSAVIFKVTIFKGLKFFFDAVGKSSNAGRCPSLFV